MYYALSDLSQAEPLAAPPTLPTVPSVSNATKKLVVYGSLSVVALSFLIWLATRK